MLLDYTQKVFDSEINLPSSKSIHNRVMILDALYGLNLNVTNPSNSGDSVLLNSILNNPSDIVNCQNAGTVFRFLTAFYAVCNRAVTLTGSERMQSRPVGDLVNALQSLGANIEYGNRTGFPPIKINGGLKQGGSVSISGETSSQFISALAMIGPKLHGGLEIIIENIVSSRPYIEMTVKLMQNLGFDVQFNANLITTKPWNGRVLMNTIDIEPDWSAVAFWYQVIAFSKQGKVFLKRLQIPSVQGDSILARWAVLLGIQLTGIGKDILLEKSSTPIADFTSWDLANYPDLAPSLIVLLAAHKRMAVFKGLESLKIKESDRTLAIQNELKKCNVDFSEDNNKWLLDASSFELKENTVFENYDDHRIAMALACLSLIKPIEMNNPEAVNKSYPDFWEALSNG